MQGAVAMVVVRHNTLLGHSRHRAGRNRAGQRGGSGLDVLACRPVGKYVDMHLRVLLSIATLSEAHPPVRLEYGQVIERRSAQDIRDCPGGAMTDFSLPEGLAVLERTPTVLRDWLGGLPDPWTRATEGPDTWSPFDVVGHLIHGEHTDWVPRARIILAQGPERTFAPYDRTAQFRESEGKTLAAMLDEFAAARRENLVTVRSWHLTDAQLALEGMHPVFGTVTLRQLLATWVAHDLGHLVQVGRVMAKRYRDAVGPWRAYLSVMDR